MKVTIITVCFNSSATIEETIKSVLSQTYPFIEYIIVDGNSSDSTLEIVHRYESRITKIISEKDNGIYDAMNKGIAIATGNIVGILNSDDLYFNESVIQQVVDAFICRDVDCVYGNLLFFRSGNIGSPVRIWRTKNYFKYFFEMGECPPHPTLFVKKRVYNEIGTYKTEYRLSSDQEFMLRMLKVNNYQSWFIDSFLVKMRIGGASTQGIKSYIISTKEIRKAWASNKLHYPFWLYFLRPIKKVLQLIRK